MYHIMQFFAWFMVHFTFGKYRISGKENVPKKGGVIYCANHASMWDPVLIGLASSRRPVIFMAKKELFKNPVVGALLKSFGSYPVDRGAADSASFRETITLLEHGKTLCIFIQGKRGEKGGAEVTNPKSGAAMFALKSNVPIIPVAVNSTYEKFAGAEITFGEPLTFEYNDEKSLRSENLRKVSNTIAEHINALLLKQKGG
ncbi:1-acyl-sn-glycerol-3-phosphate acyltransferase [Clostridia bacterium]|nr:1-acyl-sn-glycerol-3-phosphate acyltransferase [Clostridia bacterium]